MAIKTGIEWTDATWNPIRGCTHVSEGCRNCYAETVASRFCGPGSPYESVVQIDAEGKGVGKWNGQIKFVEKRLLDPLRWKSGRRIFVNSMSDLFHPGVTDEMLDRIFAVMALCPQHTFQVLTKRPERMLAYLNSMDLMWRWGHCALTAQSELLLLSGRPWDMSVCPRFPLPNVWLGVSVEDQKAADVRIPLLLQTPASVRFISAEPLLGALDLEDLSKIFPDGSEWRFGCLDPVDLHPDDDPDFRGTKIDWVICGGESGPHARPIQADWAQAIRDQCVAAGVPFFFKQWGEWRYLINWTKGPTGHVLVTMPTPEPQEGQQPCIVCDAESIGTCENCNAPICPEHEERKYEDVYTCKDHEGCSKRIDAKTGPQEEALPPLDDAQKWKYLRQVEARNKTLQKRNQALQEQVGILKQKYDAGIAARLEELQTWVGKYTAKQAQVDALTKRLNESEEEAAWLRADAYDELEMVSGRNFSEMQKRAEAAEQEVADLREQLEYAEGQMKKLCVFLASVTQTPTTCDDTKGVVDWAIETMRAWSKPLPAPPAPQEKP